LRIGGAPEEHGRTTMAKTSPLQFVRQVRSEMSKVTWPTRRETLITTGMVFFMVCLACIFFFFTDLFLATIVQFIINFF
jgi:preprotein translocase subunit SecE